MAIAVKGSGEMDELKPCPFCGAGKRWLYWGLVYPNPVAKDYLYVQCKRCGGLMVDYNLDHSLNDVKQKWNKRAKNG